MSGDTGDLGVRPRGAVALGEPAYAGGEQLPGVGNEQGWRPQTESRAVGSIRRLIHRTILLAVFVGTFAALAAWVTLLAYGGIWIFHQVPLV